MLSTDTPAIVLPLVYRPADNTLFEVNREICSSVVPNRYCCYGNHIAGSRNFLSYPWRIEQGILVPKIISKRCKLVKLYDINNNINNSGFLRHTVAF